MNPFKVFKVEEIDKISKADRGLQDRVYTKDEWIRLEKSIMDSIMLESSKNGRIEAARRDFKGILDKIEDTIKQCEV